MTTEEEIQLTRINAQLDLYKDGINKRWDTIPGMAALGAALIVVFGNQISTFSFLDKVLFTVLMVGISCSLFRYVFVLRQVCNRSMEIIAKLSPPGTSEEIQKMKKMEGWFVGNEVEIYVTVISIVIFAKLVSVWLDCV